MTDPAALESAVAHCLEPQATEEWCASFGEVIQAGFDSRAAGVDLVAEEIRLRCLTGAWDVRTADHAVNLLAGYAHRVGALPSAFWRTYLAFDAAEIGVLGENVLTATLARAGDHVVANTAAWSPSEFDHWGRGVGVGGVVVSPVPLADLGKVDVRWRGGRCTEDVAELTWIRPGHASQRLAPTGEPPLRGGDAQHDDGGADRL